MTTLNHNARFVQTTMATVPRQTGISVVLGETDDIKYSQYGATDSSDKNNLRLSQCTDRNGVRFCSDGVTPNPNSLRPEAGTAPVESNSQGKVAYGVENQEVAESLRYAVSANGACGLRHATNIRYMSDVNLVKTEERSADDN